jgi:hypothetical protein
MAQGHIVHARGQGIPQINRIVGISYRRNPAEMKFYGLRSDMLPSKSEAIAFRDTQPRTMEMYIDFEERYFDAVAAYQRAILTVSLERMSQLMSEDLVQAVQSGIVNVSGWRAGDDDSDLAWIGFGDDDNYMLQALLDVEERVESHDGPMMFEPGSTAMLHLHDEAASQRRASADLIAVSAAGRLPGLQKAPIGEILDIREDLSDYLPAFRAAVLDLADEINAEGEASSAEIADRIDRQWHQHIHPTLMDISSRLTRGRYRRHLLDEFATKDGAIAATAGAALSIGGGAVSAGVAALVPAVAGGAYPLVKAFNATLKDRDEARQSRLFFLYDAKRRLA